MDAKSLATKICSTLRAKGYQAYLVGGCVRDLLVHREPADYDVATDATPDQVERIFPRSLLVGAQFGVSVVLDESAAGSPLQVEVATFRSDIGYSDGRHPDTVVYSKSPEQDVLRRDFTINGLLLNPETNEVLDFVGGRKDISAGLIRAIGDPARRFAEDKLRMLRALRFAARFHYAVDPATFAAIQSLAPNITEVSAERLRDELTKILTEGSARAGFELLDRTGLLSYVLAEIAAMKGVAQPAEHHPEGDVWTHTLIMLAQLSAQTPETLAWGVLLHDVGKPATFLPPSGPGDRIRFNEHEHVGARMAEAICRRFRFSNEQTDQIVALVENHMKFKDVARMKTATLKRFVRMEQFDEHLELHRIDCVSSHGHLDNYDFTRRFIAATPVEQFRPARILTGEDLKSLGFRPGPAFREILMAAEDAQLEGRILDHQGALRWVGENYGPAK